MTRTLIRLLAVGVLLLDSWMGGATVVDLNGRWALDYWQQGRTGVRGPSQMDGISFQTVPATVPGNVELDLLAAGRIQDPTLDSRIYQLERWETFQWRYSRRFPTPAIPEDGQCILRFEGIDCYADIYLNGEWVGETDNMLIAHTFEVGPLLRPAGEENTLEVYLRSSVIEGRRQVTPSFSRNSPSPESIYVRRPPHSYGWDIMPRLVSAGLWRGVYLDVLEKASVTDAFWYVESLDPETRDARVYLDYTLCLPNDFQTGDLVLEYALSLDGKVCAEGETVIDAHAGRVPVTVPQAELWWPRGYGAQPLYDATLRLKDANGNILDRDSVRLGIRTARLDATPVHTEAQPGRFRFLVNGEPIFIKGSNWTPLDAFHSRDAALLDRTFALALTLNCNMLRCWGGNVYEDHAFFDLCDENGILVWQDFAMGCSQYPQDADFQARIGEEVRSVVRKLRNHPSLVLWSGNNENDVSLRWSMKAFDGDPNRDVVSRVTIPAALFECDPTRSYLPSSPYYSPEVVAMGFDPHTLPEDHLWGPRGYYKDPYYTGATCLFASETGYHGMPCRESLEQMFSPDNVYPWSDVESHRWKDPWLTKAVRESPAYGYTPKRNNLMINQVNILFGEVPSDLDRFIEASQCVQAEAVKYFIERFRTAKFSPRTGILWWNIKDGWPILSDAVVDWYFRPKKAFGYICRAQEDVCVMVADAEGKKGHPLVAVNDTREAVRGKVSVTDSASGKAVYQGEFRIDPNGRTVVAHLPKQKGQGVWIIRYSLDGSGSKINHYLYGDPPFSLDQYLGWTAPLGEHNTN